jgi:nicotinate phosphoribosyltransferase
VEGSVAARRRLAARAPNLRDGRPGRPADPGAAGMLLTDFYQLSMLDAYRREAMDAQAVFELFVRRLPRERNFLVAAGLQQAVEYLEALAFDERELAWLRSHGGFSDAFVEHLRGLRFTGDLDAMPEGSVFFADEPVLRVSAPLPQAQLVESRLLNLVHFQTLVASKAARVVLAAPGKLLVDFGMRRAHGEEAALYAARAAYLAGFAGTATVEAARRFGIPAVGTMAHSFVQAHGSEAGAFEAFVRARPRQATLLIDTYDTERAAARVVELARRLAGEGLHIAGVRLDSGDLAAHAKAVRRVLDEGGCREVTIFASSSLDEQRIAGLLAAGAPIDGFGVGSALDTSADVPVLDAVYKLQSYAGVARRKRSEGKATWPGAKQVWREIDARDGTMCRDHLRLVGEAGAGQALLQPVLRGGRRVGPMPSLEDIRRHHAQQMRRLPPGLRTLEPSTAAYPVEVSAAIRALAHEVDAATTS